MFGGYKKLQKRNSASMCKFRPIGHHSTAVSSLIHAVLPVFKASITWIMHAHFTMDDVTVVISKKVQSLKGIVLDERLL